MKEKGHSINGGEMLWKREYMPRDARQIRGRWEKGPLSLDSSHLPSVQIGATLS